MQRPEPLPPRLRRGLKLRPTKRHLMRLVPSHMRNHLASLATKPDSGMGSTPSVDRGMLDSRGLDPRVCCGSILGDSTLALSQENALPDPVPRRGSTPVSPG